MAQAARHISLHKSQKVEARVKPSRRRDLAQRFLSGLIGCIPTLLHAARLGHTKTVVWILGKTMTEALVVAPRFIGCVVFATAKYQHTLQHRTPPSGCLSRPSHFFRQADGGGNCLQDPDIGRAGTCYARSVQSQFSYPPTSLPDPGLVFDTILKRREVRIPIFFPF
jgi:hypothetical protein